MNTHALNAIFAVTGRPGYVKTAGESAPAGFAEPLTGKYPCHTKSATFLSACEAFSDNAAPAVQQKIALVARFFDIGDDVKSALSKLAASRAQLTEDQLPDSDFALCQEFGGAKVRKFASVDAETTVDAAIAFHDNRCKYPFSWRKSASVNFLRKAAQFKAVLPDYVSEYLHKAAGFAVATSDSIDNILVERANRSKLAGAEASEKLASLLDSLSQDETLRHDMDLMGEAIALVDQFDRQTKISAYYGHGVSLPEEMLAITEPVLSKHAAAQSNIVKLINGHSVDVRHIGGDVLDTVSEGMSKMSHAKLADVLPTLPKGDADLLVELMPKHAAAAMAPVMGANLGAMPPVKPLTPGPQAPKGGTVPGAASIAAHPVDGAPKAPQAPLGVNTPEHMNAGTKLGK